MDREKLITLCIGLLIGIALAGAYLLAPKVLPQFFPKHEKLLTLGKPTNQKTGPEEKTTVTDPTIGFKLLTPENNTTTKDYTISVSGTAAPSSKLLVSTLTDEKAIVAGEDGKFSTLVKLEDGQNIITVVYLNPSSKPHPETRAITVIED